jgi:hypothetical protein
MTHGAETQLVMQLEALNPVIARRDRREAAAAQQRALQ